MKKDITMFIKSCHVCQFGGKHNQIIPRAPLYTIWVVTDPFERTVIDCVEPLHKTENGNHYGCCYNVCRGLPFNRYFYQFNCETFTSFGIQKEIHSDRNSNFTRDLFHEFLKLLGILQQTSTAYHP